MGCPFALRRTPCVGGGTKHPRQARLPPCTRRGATLRCEQPRYLGRGPTVPPCWRAHAASSWAMAASVVLPARRISAMTACVVALALVACSDLAARARAAVSTLPAVPSFRPPRRD